MSGYRFVSEEMINFSKSVRDISMSKQDREQLRRVIKPLVKLLSTHAFGARQKLAYSNDVEASQQYMHVARYIETEMIP